jgi:hypothetical protein
MGVILSREQMLNSQVPVYLKGDPKELRLASFNEQLTTCLVNIANGITTYWRYRKNEKNLVYKYLFTPCAFKWEEGTMRPYLHEILGTKEQAMCIFRKRLETAFPGFSTININEFDDWCYTIEIDLMEKKIEKLGCRETIRKSIAYSDNDAYRAYENGSKRVDFIASN